MQVKFLTGLLTKSRSKINIIMQNNELLLEKCRSLAKIKNHRKYDNTESRKKKNALQTVNNGGNCFIKFKGFQSNITSNTELPAENVDKTGEINRNTQNSSNNWGNVSRKKAPNHKDKVNMTCTGLKNKTDNTIFRAATSRRLFYIVKIAGKEVAEDTIRDYLGEFNGYDSINIIK
ncbi:hypothetical protein WA026_007407 [Henosepilachna vigintioctopunctata]|uniref:Uncharacterized protein n=1 Tax=Henosepilachna vigintioctopunctata TaxID=420089 RepID=A0AAW1UYA6_9CUCU